MPIFFPLKYKFFKPEALIVIKSTHKTRLEPCKEHAVETASFFQPCNELGVPQALLCACFTDRNALVNVTIFFPVALAPACLFGVWVNSAAQSFNTPRNACSIDERRACSGTVSVK